MVSILKLFGKEHLMFLFYIDPNPLITSWLKELAQVNGDKFYSLTDLKEAGYFLYDLKPDVLVIESEILKREKEFLLQAQAEYESLFSLPIITVGKESAVGHFGMEIKGHISKPINPEIFFNQIKEMLQVKDIH